MKIGSYTLPNKYILAPMAGLVSSPFRAIAREHGAGATPTELISANGLMHKNGRTRTMLRPTAGETPFWVQLFGSSPERMARAAEISVELGANIIDVNMGCPVRKVTGDGAGCALMQDVPRAVAMIEAIRQAVGDSIPVTAKFRSGWNSDSINYLEFGRALAGAGVVAITLHARTRAQRYSGLADWSHIAELKKAVTIPVIGNGDIRSVEDARRMQQQTGCDALMIGRGALGNPWIFSSLQQGKRFTPSPAERTRVVLDHFQRLAEHGDAQRAVYQSRTRLLAYSKGLDGGVEFRRNIVRVEEPERFIDELRRYFCSADVARGFPKPTDLSPGIDIT